MSQGSIREYAAALRPRYQVAGKEGKGRLLDEFCAVTRYHRKAAGGENHVSARWA